MKIQVTLFAILFYSLLFLSSSCSKKTAPPPPTDYISAEVNYLSGNNGTITMRAIGVGKNEAEAYNKAVYNAFDVLFFRGLPESDQKLALVGTNEDEERIKNKNYFDEFYGGRYDSFVMSAIPSSEVMKGSGGIVSIAVDVKINLSALRMDLEQNNVIRKFGF